MRLGGGVDWGKHIYHTWNGPEYCSLSVDVTYSIFQKWSQERPKPHEETCHTLVQTWGYFSTLQTVR